MDVEAEAGQRRNRRWFQTEGSWVTAPLIGQVRPRLNPAGLTYNHLASLKLGHLFIFM